MNQSIHPSIHPSWPDQGLELGASVGEEGGPPHARTFPGLRRRLSPPEAA